MYLKSSIQTSSIDCNVHITLNVSSNIPIQYKKKYNNKYMTPIHQNNLGTELFLSQILCIIKVIILCIIKVFRLEMLHIRLSKQYGWLNRLV